MKAIINESGMLEIQAESALESYALIRWSDANCAVDAKNITIHTGFNEEEK